MQLHNKCSNLLCAEDQNVQILAAGMHGTADFLVLGLCTDCNCETWSSARRTRNSRHTQWGKSKPGF